MSQATCRYCFRGALQKEHEACHRNFACLIRHSPSCVSEDGLEKQQTDVEPQAHNMKLYEVHISLCLNHIFHFPVSGHSSTFHLQHTDTWQLGRNFELKGQIIQMPTLATDDHKNPNVKATAMQNLLSLNEIMCISTANVIWKTILNI